MLLDEAERQGLFTGRVAVLATNGPDGRPQLSAVWYLVEDDLIKISVTAQRQKTRNLVRDARCSFFVFHPASPNFYVEVRGDAEIEPDPHYEFADRIGAKYDSDLRDFDSPQDRRVLLVIRPRRVNIIDVRD